LFSLFFAGSTNSLAAWLPPQVLLTALGAGYGQAGALVSSDHGLQLFHTTPTSLVAYFDADWVSCPDTRCSTSGYGVFLGGKLVSWSSKCQHMVSCSSAEAEYRAVANDIAETCWLWNSDVT